MGCPASGRLMFIHSIQNKVRAGLLSDTEKPRSTKGCLLVSDCKELILELLHSNRRLTMNSTSTNISAEKSFYRSENGMLASPKTPLNQSKLSFANSSPLASPRCEESASSVITPDESFVEPFDVEQVLGDDTSKRLLQTCATTWLYSRCLLRGNLVTILVLSQLCLLWVVGAKYLSDDKANHDLLHESSELVDKVNDAFLVKRETKVCFHLPSNLESETPQRRVLSTVQCKDAMANTGVIKIGWSFKRICSFEGHHNIIIYGHLVTVCDTSYDTLLLRSSVNLLFLVILNLGAIYNLFYIKAYSCLWWEYSFVIKPLTC